MADGCTSSGGRFIITVGTVDIEVMERIRLLMDSNFGLAPNQITEGEGGGYVDIQFQSRDLVRWMERLGWVKGSSPNAFIPTEVLTGSADTARAFLRGLFEGDGHLHSSSGYPSFSTTSERLAIEAQQLLLSLGVVARRGIIKRRQSAFGRLTVHTLSIVDEHSVRTFSEEIGFVSDRKQERLELAPRPKVNTSDIIPNQARVLRSSYSFVGRGSGPGRSRRGANRRLYRALMHYISEEHPRALPRKRLLALMKRFPEIGGNEHLRQMSDVSRVYTRVTAIRPDHAATADLEVPGPASFVANGILGHHKRPGADMEATNPCGEQPLLPYESCNLGSIDLARHMKRNAAGRWDVDWKKLEVTIRATVRMLDDVIDMNAYPVKQIEEMTYATRKIGLGVMGFARMLFMLEVPYDSKEGVDWGRKIMQFIHETGYNESAKLAEERGVYPAWEGSRHQEKGLRLRNSYVTTVAPTGTLSMIADTSGGCEPEFSLIWYKRVMDGEGLPYFLDS